MKTKNPNVWTLVYSSRREGIGHKIFQDNSLLYSLADWSGVTPDDTDDGPLYVCENDPIVVRIYNEKLQFIVTVRNAKNNLGFVWTDGATAHALSIRTKQRLSFGKLEKEMVDLVANVNGGYDHE